MRTSEQPVLMFICTKKQKIYACAMGRSSAAAAVSCCAAVASPGAAAVAPAPNQFTAVESRAFWSFGDM